MIEAECGHKTYRSKKITIFENEEKSSQLEITINGIKPKYCHDCFEKMMIRCAWCGGSILPGDPITLYTPKDNFQKPEYAVSYKGKDDKKEKLVGCLSVNCAESGADRAGFWIAPGKVQRVLSPIEKAFLTGEMVIEENLGDINSATLIKD